MNLIINCKKNVYFLLQIVTEKIYIEKKREVYLNF
jgi:hypothetical protein